MVTPRKSSGLDRARRAKGSTPEARENQLAAMAYDLAEQQMAEGSASAMVITHFLKLKTKEQQLKEEKLRKENLLLEAKTDQISSSMKNEEMYKEALAAIRQYQGLEVHDEDV